MAEGPVNSDPNTDAPADGPSDGIALCLSGGGYRAMIFHVGAIWRLNEVGLLSKIRRVSSVSGGSITAGVLGLHWKDIQFDAKGVAQRLDIVFDKIRHLASHTIDAKSILGGIFSGDTISERVAKAYRDHLFGDATLQNLPDDANNEGPRFVINATSVQTGSLFRFSRPYLADYQVGRVMKPNVPLAVAVAASSAFPPFLSPAEIDLRNAVWEQDPKLPRLGPPFTTKPVLTDGGVYDNLGLETAWKNYKTILVSDGGGKLGLDEKPDHDWLRHSKRALDVIDNQVRSLRYRHLIGSYQALPTQDNHRDGAYWGIRTHILDYKLPDSLPCPHKTTMSLAAIPTRLEEMDPALQERLINWGYAVCDAALRAYYNPGNFAAPSRFPYDGRGV
jgi:NTE family protein